MVNTCDSIQENGQNSSLNLAQPDLNYWLLFFKTFSFILVLMNKCFQIWYNNVWIVLKPQISLLCSTMIAEQAGGKRLVALPWRAPFSKFTSFELFSSKFQVGLLEQSHKKFWNCFLKVAVFPFSCRGFLGEGELNRIVTKHKVILYSSERVSLLEK